MIEGNIGGVIFEKDGVRVGDSFVKREAIRRYDDCVMIVKKFKDSMAGIGINSFQKNIILGAIADILETKII